MCCDVQCYDVARAVGGELDHTFFPWYTPSIIHHPLLSSPTPGGSSIHNSQNRIKRVRYPTVLSTEYGIVNTLSTVV